MKKQTNQSWWLLLAAIILVGVGTSAFAQERNKHFALNNLSPVTANENFGLNTAPWSFSFTKPNSLFATNFNLLAADDYPKPDFSGIEEWYEVVKYEYDFVQTLPKILSRRQEESGEGAAELGNEVVRCGRCSDREKHFSESTHESEHSGWRTHAALCVCAV